MCSVLNSFYNNKKYSVFWSLCCHCKIFYSVWFAHVRWYTCNNTAHGYILHMYNDRGFLKYVGLNFRLFCFAFYCLFVTSAVVVRDIFGECVDLKIFRINVTCLGEWNDWIRWSITVLNGLCVGVGGGRSDEIEN